MSTIFQTKLKNSDIHGAFTCIELRLKRLKNLGNILDSLGEKTHLKQVFNECFCWYEDL